MNKSVYFFYSHTTNKVKIGVSASWLNRLSNIQPSSPDKLICIKIEGGEKANGWHANSHETDLHNKFSEYKSHGEWFNVEGELLEYLKTDLEKETEETTELNAKDAIAANQKLFAELLGSDKARGQDIGDMLLRFSGSGGNTLGEKFQNYVRAESAAGPSRSEKIKQTAAGLAINDYVAGKRSKENMEMMIEKTKFGVDYTMDAQKAAKDISNMNFSDGLDRMVELMGGKKNRMDPVVIKSVLTIQMPGQQINIKNFNEKSKNEVGGLDAKEFDIGINIVTYDGGKMLVERVGDIVTEVPDLFIT